MDLTRRTVGQSAEEKLSMKEHIRILENTLIYKGPLERAAFVTYFGMDWACTGGV